MCSLLIIPLNDNILTCSVHVFIFNVFKRNKYNTKINEHHALIS